MGRFLKKTWRYLTAALTGKFNELADPKVELDMAIEEAHRQNKLLRDAAANVIANQKTTQMNLDRANTNLDKTRASARQALIMEAEAGAAGDTERAGKMKDAAESFANRLVILEDEVATLESLLVNAATASDQAKQSVANNAILLERKMTERRELLAKLGQAEMAEQNNAAMESLTAAVGTDVPTMDEVRNKIEGRLAKAQGHTELAGATADGAMLEVERAAMNSEASARLSKLRSELGIVGPEAETAVADDRDAIEAEIDAAAAAALAGAEDEPAGTATV